MILDKELVFSEAQAVKSTAASTKVVDLGAAGDAIGQELTFHAVVGTTFAGLTNIKIAVQTSEDGTTWTDMVSSGTIALANLTAGSEVFCVRIPQGLKRHIRLNYTVSGTGTAGTITAFASKDL